MIKVLAEVWIHSNAETGEPCEVSITKIKSDEFLCFDFIRFFLEYDFDDRIDEFNFLKLDEWHVIELYFEYEDGWCFECAKNTEQQIQADSRKKEENMANWGIASTAPEIEKIKAELADYLHGLNSCAEIDYLTYSQLFDFSLPLIQKAYELGKKEAQQVIQPDLYTN